MLVILLTARSREGGRSWRGAGATGHTGYYWTVAGKRDKTGLIYAQAENIQHTARLHFESIACLAGIIWSTAAAAADTTNTTNLTAISKLRGLSNSSTLKLAGRGSAERQQHRGGAKCDAGTVPV